MTLNHAAERATKLRQLLPTIGLSETFADQIKELNPSANLPYHGHDHSVTVALNVAAGIEAEWHTAINERNPASTYTLNELMRVGVVAALFHDFGHTGTDDEARNLPNAVIGFAHTMTKLHPEMMDWLMNILAPDLIYATARPAADLTNTDELGQHLAAIIRDADRMQTLEPDGESFAVALSAELGIHLDEEQDLKFFENEVWYTQWGRDRVSSRTPWGER